MPSFPSPNPPKNRYHMFAKHSLACLTHLGHSFVSESYKASSEMALERTTLPSPPNQTWELKKHTCRKQDTATCFSLLGVSVPLFCLSASYTPTISFCVSLLLHIPTSMGLPIFLLFSFHTWILAI